MAPARLFSLFDDPPFFPQLPMTKADGDSRAQGAAGGGRDAASPAPAESKNVKPAASTIQEDIPPVHVLEAAERQDRKETEDLLSGFDRPGRGPKAAPRERDFVDYYAKKPGGPDSASGRAAAAARAPVVIREKARDESTVIVRRNRQGVPGWVVFGGAALLMLLVGGVVAYVATADGRPEGAAAGATPSAGVASAATTLTGATTGKPSVKDESIPPPSAASVVAPVAEATAVEPSPVVAPRGAAKREPKAGASGAAAAAAAPSAPAVRGTTAVEPSKAAPREDFIRDL
jgi:hypothetical protein